MLALTVLDHHGRVICAEDHTSLPVARRRGLAAVSEHLGVHEDLRSCQVLDHNQESFEMALSTTSSSARILVQSMGMNQHLNEQFEDLMRQVSS